MTQFLLKYKKKIILISVAIVVLVILLIFTKEPDSFDTTNTIKLNKFITELKNEKNYTIEYYLLDNNQKKLEVTIYIDNDIARLVYEDKEVYLYSERDLLYEYTSINNQWNKEMIAASNYKKYFELEYLVLHELYQEKLNENSYYNKDKDLNVFLDGESNCYLTRDNNRYEYTINVNNNLTLPV